MIARYSSDLPADAALSEPARSSLAALLKTGLPAELSRPAKAPALMSATSASAATVTSASTVAPALPRGAVRPTAPASATTNTLGL